MIKLLERFKEHKILILVIIVTIILCIGMLIFSNIEQAKVEVLNSERYFEMPDRIVYKTKNQDKYYVFNNDHHLPPEKKTAGEEPWPELNAIIYDIKAGAGNDD